ncbi:MAG: homocysteine S-methyltransferase family protein [Phycisphaerae bacterium]
MSNGLESYRDDIAVADGGWSTQLQARGVPQEAPAELANLTHPHLVEALARDYVAAGARFITTNTFSANRLVFERRGLQPDLAEINRTGAALAKKVIDDGDALAAGSIGPSGKILAVREATEEQLAAAFAEQATALAEGGADVIVLETFSELAEVLLALEAARKAAGLPVIASMSFDSGPQRTRTMMGTKAEDCASALEEAGADAVGCNCGVGVATILPTVVALRANTKLPLWVKPNAGLPELEDDHVVYKQTPDEFGQHVPTLLDAGVNIIGGCCGTGPEHIKRVAALVESHKRKAH